MTWEETYREMRRLRMEWEKSRWPDGAPAVIGGATYRSALAGPIIEVELEEGEAEHIPTPDVIVEEKK